MTDENDDGSSVNDGSDGGPTVPKGSENGQGGPSVPSGGQGQSGEQGEKGDQGGPSVPGQGQSTTGGSGQSTGGGQAQSTGESDRAQSTGGGVQTTGTATQSGGADTAAGSGGSGLDPNVAGAIAYLFAPLGGIAMYVMGDEEFVRFHAKQGIAFGLLLAVVWVGIAVVWPIGGLVLGFAGLAGIFDLLMTLVSLGAFLLGFAAWAFLTYKAYQGERFQIPIIGGFVS